MSEREDESGPAAPDPPFVATAEDKRRWDLCRAIAEAIFEEDSASVWMAARALFRGEIETGN